MVFRRKETVKLTPGEIKIEDLEPSKFRSPGIHHSTILKEILRGIDPKRFGGEGVMNPARTFTGFIWEEVLGEAFTKLARMSKPALCQLELQREMCGRTVFFTLDAFDTERWKVHEYKATWMSSRHEITDQRFWHWFAQLKSYCKVADTRAAELYALFVNGDYSRWDEGGPVMRRWEVEFTETEIEENWTMVKGRLSDMIRKGKV